MATYKGTFKSGNGDELLPKTSHDQVTGLATVAHTGSYSDLLNPPPIPSVSDATITIKQAGQSDQSFTLNGSAKTITLTDNNTNYYPTAVSWTNGTTAGPTGTMTMNGTSNVSIPALPSASDSRSGIVTTGYQSFSGEKTFVNRLNLGDNIPSKGDGSTVYKGNDLMMNHRTAGASGFYVNSAQRNRFYGLAYSTAYECKCNYKGDGSSTASTNADGMWICDRYNSGTTHSGALAQMFDGRFTSGAIFPASAMSTKPLVLTIITTGTTAIDATDTNYLAINGWRFAGSAGSSDYYGQLTNYKLEILTDKTNNTWVKVFERTNVSDSVSSLMFPIWSSLGGTENYTFFYGIRLTVSGAVAGESGYFGFTELKLMECRPASRPSDSVGAVDKLGDTLQGDLMLSSKYPDMSIRPEVDNNGYLGTSSNKWRRVYANLIYGTTLYEDNTALSDKYLGKSAKAADADKLDGQDSTYYLNYNNLTNKPSAVLYTTQSLTDTQKAQARSNIGAGTSSFSGSYNDLTNKPSAVLYTSQSLTDAQKSQARSNIGVDTVNNGVLTIQKNGTQVATFSANQSGNATANITVPTKTSDLTNDSVVSYSTSQSLSDGQKTQARTNIGAGTSSFSGDYEDLTTRPDIPSFVINGNILEVQPSGGDAGDDSHLRYVYLGSTYSWTNLSALGTALYQYFSSVPNGSASIAGFSLTQYPNEVIMAFCTYQSSTEWGFWFQGRSDFTGQLQYTISSSTATFQPLSVSNATSLSYTTTAPTSANPTGLKAVYLNSSPASYQSGYLYFIKTT